jgi:hypothetical protein
MIRIYIHPALECYSSFYGMEKFIGVPQFSFAFQTVYQLLHLGLDVLNK